MLKKDAAVLSGLKIGIVGCGHLGQAIAQSLLSHGLREESLQLSFGGSPKTLDALQKRGLAPCITDNGRIFRDADILLVATRPQDIQGLGKLEPRKEALVVSCMSGVPIELLGRIFQTQVHRMMFSGPDTILAGNGVATAFPRHSHLLSLIKLLGLREVPVYSEDELDVFTAGVCLPAALLVTDRDAANRAVERIGGEYPLLPGIFEWAKKVLPEFRSKAEEEEYIRRMVSKGGITEAIVQSLQTGEPLDSALRRGIARMREISAETRKTVETQAAEREIENYGSVK